MRRALERVGCIRFADRQRIERAKTAFDALEAGRELVDRHHEAQELGVELVGRVLGEGGALFDLAQAITVIG